MNSNFYIFLNKFLLKYVLNLEFMTLTWCSCEAERPIFDTLKSLNFRDVEKLEIGFTPSAERLVYDCFWSTGDSGNPRPRPADFRTIVGQQKIFEKNENFSIFPTIVGNPDFLGGNLRAFGQGEAGQVSLCRFFRHFWPEKNWLLAEFCKIAFMARTFLFF